MALKSKVMLELDASNLQYLVDEVKRNTTEDQFQRIIGRALLRAGKSVRTAIAQEVIREYHVKYSLVLSTMHPAVVSTNPANMTIKVSGVREKTGKKETYPAWAAGWDHPSGRARSKARRYSRSGVVTMEDVRGVRSTLPSGLGTDARHFMVMRGPYAGKVFAAIPRVPGASLYIKHIRGKRMCRYARANEKIRPAVGIAIPQMPLNRAADAIQLRFEEIFQKRVAHEWENAMKGIAVESRFHGKWKI